MIKVGSSNVEYDAERVRTVREALGKDFRIIVDVNQGWDVDTAVKFCKLIKQCEIDLFEQPVPGWDVDSLARIRRKVDIPVSADEGVQTIHDAKHLIQKDAIDVFSIKVAKHGGIYRTKQIMELADVFGIRCLMNSMLEEGITEAASLQLGAVAPNLMDVGHAYFSPLRLDDDITTYSAQLKDGFVSISEKPGLGIDIRPDILKKYVFQSNTIA
jgi:muconate cycloisomerase